MRLEQKHTGYILIGVAIVLIILLVSFNNSIQDSSSSACGCSADGELTCPHASNLPYQTYIGGLVVLGILVLGGYSIWASKQKVGISAAKKTKIKTLPEDEKKIYKSIDAAGGAVFQSELVGKTKLSKVKVSRLLDKLEGKGLVERRRRGMTNLVLLKK
jgi:uncharacterized membrane protein